MLKFAQPGMLQCIESSNEPLMVCDTVLDCALTFTPVTKTLIGIYAGRDVKKVTEPARAAGGNLLQAFIVTIIIVSKMSLTLTLNFIIHFLMIKTDFCFSDTKKQQLHYNGNPIVRHKLKVRLVDF
jgi:hypothetical protein